MRMLFGTFATIVTVSVLGGLLSDRNDRAADVKLASAKFSAETSTEEIVRDILSSASPEQQSTVRGRLYRVNAYGQAYPAPGISVRLWHERYGASPWWSSDREGMFYIPNVPPGDFLVEVWLTGRPEDVIRRWVRVDGRPVVDVLPAIRVP